MLQKTLASFALLSSIAGCGQPPPPKTPDGYTAQAAETPDWVKPMIGKSLAEAFPGSGEACLGFTDKVEKRFSEAPMGVEVVGWGWSTSGARIYERVVTVDGGGLIQGGGQSGIERGDVVAANPNVTDARVGFAAVSLQTNGVVRVFGVAGNAVCQLGPEIALQNS